MIQTKILFIEQELLKNPDKHLELLNATSSIKKLLNQIDLRAEVVPLKNIKKAVALFENLKEEPLTKTEKQVIKKLIKY